MIEAFKEEPFKLDISEDGRATEGNQVRRTFDHPEAAALIFFCPVDLLDDLLAIIGALGSGLIVDWEKFKACCDNWLDRFHASEIAWCWLPPTLHFLLHHGWKVN